MTHNHPDLTNSLVWSPTASLKTTRRRFVDTEDCYWLVAEEIHDVDDHCWNNNNNGKPLGTTTTTTRRRRQPVSLMIPMHDDDDHHPTRCCCCNRDDDDDTENIINGFSSLLLQPRVVVEREDSGLFGLEFLEDDH